MLPVQVLDILTALPGQAAVDGTKNKELINLYLQYNYIVKSKYPERQITFVEGTGKAADLGDIIPVKGKGIDGIDLNVINPSNYTIY